MSLLDSNNKDEEQELDILTEESGIKKIKRSKYDEPESHKKNFTNFEKCWIYCFGEKINTKLSKSEISCFYDLREEANKTFGAKSADYKKLFDRLWELLTGKNLGETIENK